MRYQNITDDVRIGEDAIVSAGSVAELADPHEKTWEQLNAVSTEVVSARSFVGGANKANPTISITNPLVEQPEEDRPDLGEDLNPCFHDRTWAAVLNESYGFKPFYLEAARDGVRSGMIPLMMASGPFGLRKRGVSLPFADFCEPFAADHSCFEELFKAAVGLGRSKGWRYLELRGGAGWLPQTTCSRFYFGHVLYINKDDTQLLAAMNDSTRRNIRNAQRRNVHYFADHEWEAMQTYYRLHCRTRKKHGVPPQPIRFFRSLHHHSIDNGNSFIALARLNDQIIAGAVFLLYGKHAIFKFGASDERLLFARANDVIMWEAIRECRDRGVKLLYFGRTEPGNMGLRRFKKGFGAREYPISYFRYDLNTMKFSTRKCIKEINGRNLSFLPLFLLRFIGETAYPFIG
jgi:hypothetical protein